MTNADKLQVLLGVYATVASRTAYSISTVKFLDDLEDSMADLCSELITEEATTEEPNDPETETETNEE